MTSQLDIRRTNILVISGSAVSRQIVSEMLTDLGCRAETVSGGRRGLELVYGCAQRGRPFDLVIVDAAVGDVGARLLAGFLATDRALPPPRMVVMTSLPHHWRKEELDCSGFSAMVPKPCTIYQLAEGLSRALGKISARGSIGLLGGSALNRRDPRPYASGGRRRGMKDSPLKTPRHAAEARLQWRKS